MRGKKKGTATTQPWRWAGKSSVLHSSHCCGQSSVRSNRRNSRWPTTVNNKSCPCETPAKSSVRVVASHELQAMPAHVPRAAVSRTNALHLTPSSRHDLRSVRGRATHGEGVLDRRATSSEVADLSRGSGGGRRRRDGVTVAAHPRSAAPRSLLASRGTTRAVLWKARPGYDSVSRPARTYGRATAAACAPCGRGARDSRASRLTARADSTSIRGTTRLPKGRAVAAGGLDTRAGASLSAFLAATADAAAGRRLDAD